MSLTWTLEQEHALSLIKEGKNILLTGMAGSGKTALIQYLLSERKTHKLLPERGVYVTASTGMAACLIHANTVHSFGGIGLGDKPFNQIIGNINRKCKQRWLNTKVLIIDEISMITPNVFTLLDKIARHVRKAPLQSFGGIQLILVGDFLQLPPIQCKSYTSLTQGIKPSQMKFCFQTEAWKEGNIEIIMLKQVFRQKNEAFQKALMEIRLGNTLSDDSLNLLNQRFEMELQHPKDIPPTKLYCLRNEVDSENASELNKCVLPEYNYMALDTGEEVKLSKCNWPEILQLRVGALIMFLKNDVEKGLVNGSRGIIKEFVPVKDKYVDDLPLVKKRKLSPSLEEIHDKINVTDVEEKVKNEKDNEPNEDGIKENKIKEIEIKENILYYPKVLFENGKTFVIEPEVFEIEMDGITIAQRIQIPINLAWAITVHKSQGATLKQAIVDLNSVFEESQVYVALSRVTDLEGLSLKHKLRKEQIRSHQDAVLFYNKL